MKRFVCLLLFLLIVLPFGQASAATIRAEASPLLGPGYIEKGIPFTIDLYMNNNDGFDHLGYSMPFAFYSPDAGITTITHRDVDGYGPFESILMPNGYDTYWTLFNEWTGISFDGSLADTINHTTATMTGWPSGLGEVLNLQFAFQIDEEGAFCIDSVSIPGQSPPGKFDWLFDFPTTFNGPYCWDVVTEIPQDPEIGVNPASFIFEAEAGGAPPNAQVLQITNTAAGTLNWAATWNSSWLNVSPAFGTAPANAQLFCNTTGLGAGTHYDTITVSDPNAANNPVLVPVMLILNEPPPVIQLSATYFSFNAVADSDNPPDQILSVSNIGGGNLNWSAIKSESWLTIDPTMGINDGDITLSVDITGMTYGVYYDYVIVSDPSASNSPQTAEIRLEIGSSLPVLFIEPSSFFVAVDVDEPLPDDRQFTVTNAGAGLLNFYLEESSDRIVSLTPDSGSVPLTVTVQFDSIPGMAGQSFYDTVWVYSAEAINSPQIIVFQFYLSNDPPKILVSRDSLFIEIYECGQGTAPFNFPPLTIYNGGGEPFIYTLNNSQPWLEVSPQTALPPQVLNMEYLYKQMAPGTYYDTLVVTAATAINSPQNIPITLVILPTDQNPEIWVDTQFVTVAAQEERPGKDYFVQVNNVNPGCMEWTLQEEISWVGWQIDSSNYKIYPWNVQFMPNGYGMVMGHYEDTALIAAPDATNNPLTLYFDIFVWKFYGDVNYDGVVNLLDVVYMIYYLYLDGPEPIPERRVGDCNCDYRIDLLDISAIIDYLYYDAGPLCGNPY